eukprot:TRINITY_DN10936_c0_g1_i1.p1 TRINITY_DN10936_c0_g1~~TRINITY_DN10936_c0_g1_i1.p1  ORF type:complete len:389 (+),score=76.94 TRINITY_DN10936_c0_g1_i1:69-1235(+)
MLPCSKPFPYPTVSAKKKKQPKNLFLSVPAIYTSDPGSQLSNLIQEIEENRTFTELDLSRNASLQDYFRPLMTALASNMSVRTLRLTHNDLWSTDCSALGKMLQSNQYLKHLDLSHNSIDSSGSIILADSLRFNTTLTSLILTYNNIDSKGAKIFLSMMDSNKTLRNISLRFNQIDEPKVLELLENRNNQSLNPYNGNRNSSESQEIFNLKDMLKAAEDTISSLELKLQNEKREVGRLKTSTDTIRKTAKADLDRVTELKNAAEFNLTKEIEANRSLKKDLQKQMTRNSLLQKQLKAEKTDQQHLTDLLKEEEIKTELAVKKLAEYRKKNAKEYETHICKVCNEQEIDVLLLPCGHFCVCETCASSLPLSKCPICRAPFFQKVKAYLC